MNRGIAPEDIYSKLIELEGNDEEKAISLVQEFIKGTKKRSWSKSMTELMKKAIEIIDLAMNKEAEKADTYNKALKGIKKEIDEKNDEILQEISEKEKDILSKNGED